MAIMNRLALVFSFLFLISFSSGCFARKQEPTKLQYIEFKQALIGRRLSVLAACGCGLAGSIVPTSYSFWFTFAGLGQIYLAYKYDKDAEKLKEKFDNTDLSSGK